MRKKTSKSNGKVYLVGAGPGDPGLITVKGLNCIREADVIIADYLVDKNLLGEAPEDAECIHVPWSQGRQEKINELLVYYSRAGKMVVRLKGGDPFVFGRGGEEGLHLRDHSIPFEVVPGITAAVAVPAYAGIPVTHREITSTMTVITGHESPGKDRTDLDWEAIAKRIGTLVFYMGARNLAVIVEKLIKHGRAQETPVALIQWGTTYKQRTLVGTLTDIVSKSQKSSFTPPVLIVVGEVVALRENLSWFELKPLFGKRVLITRARGQAGELSESLLRVGAEPVEMPLVRIEKLDDWSKIDSFLSNLSSFNYLVFTSVNTVDAFMDRLYKIGLDIRSLGGLFVAAVGEVTSEALRNWGIEADLCPEESRADKLVDALRSTCDLQGARIFFPSSDIAGTNLLEGLTGAGAFVTAIPFYKTKLESRLSDEVESMFINKEIHIVTFASPSAVSGFTKALGRNISQYTRDVRIACIGPVTAEAATRAGLSVDIISGQASIPGLVEAIVNYKLAT